MFSVAVLLATYNGEKYISAQLESLVNQSYKNFVCYIHDDGSTDQTVSICKEFCSRHREQFVFLDYPKTGGAKNNFFSLMKHVEADYIFFCDQDDYWLPEKIHKMVEAVCNAQKGMNGCLVYSDLKVADERLKVTDESFYRLTHVRTKSIDYKNSLVKGFIPGCSMMIDKILLNKANQYRNIQNVKMHDWWIVIVACLTGANVVYVPESLVLYRQHSNNTIGAKNLSTFDRIKFNLNRIWTGELKAAKKQNIETPRQQAKELFETGFGSEEKRAFLKQFYDIGSKNKFSRIFFYLQNFWNVYRLWWMVLWV